MLVGITGGTGFIGKELVLRHLSAGDSVRVFTRCARNDYDGIGGVRWYEGDLVVATSQVERFVDGIDVLYHCAAELRDSTKMAALHVQGTNNLCSAAQGRVAHWVQLSSVGVYGPHRNGIVVEDTPLNPVGTYELTKAKSDEIVLRAAERGSFTFSILRPSNVYGPTMVNRSLHQMISMIQRRLFFYIGKEGGIINYVYLDNVVDALLLCAQKKEAINKIFILSDYCELEQFINYIADELSVSRPKMRLPDNIIRFLVRICEHIPRFPLTESRIDALTSRSIYSNEKIERELSYTHLVSIREGVRRLVNAYE